MAVNKITNKEVVNREGVNRATQISTKNETIRGNRGTTIVPGHNFSEKLLPGTILVSLLPLIFVPLVETCSALLTNSLLTTCLFVILLTAISSSQFFKFIKFIVYFTFYFF